MAENDNLKLYGVVSSMGAQGADRRQDENREAALVTLLMQTYGVAGTILQSASYFQKVNEQDRYRYYDLLKFKLKELQIYTGGSSEGYAYVKQVAARNGISFDTILQAASLIHDKSKDATPDSSPENLLNPSKTIETIPPTSGSDLNFNIQTSNGSAEFNYNAHYNPGAQTWMQSTSAHSEVSSGDFSGSTNVSVGQGALRSELHGSKFATQNAAASNAAYNEIRTATNGPTTAGGNPPAPGTDRVDVNSNRQKQAAVDKLLRDAAPLLDAKADSAAKAGAATNVLGDIQQLPPQLREGALHAYNNPSNGVSKEQSLMGYLQQNLSNEVLYSLSNNNKDLAGQYAPVVMQGAMVSFGGQSPEEAKKTATTLRQTLTDMGLSDKQTMELLHRMNSKKLTPEQQKDLAARLQKGEGLSALSTYYSDQISSFMSDHPEVQDSVAMYLSKPENEGMAQQMMPFISDAVAKQMGIKDSSMVQSFVSGLTSTMGMPAHAVMGMLKGGAGFLREFLDPTPQYNNASALSTQAFNRLLAPTRNAALGRLREIQTQAGTENLMKMAPGLKEEYARQIAELLNSPAAEMGLNAIKPQIASLLTAGGVSEEQAASMMDSFEKNTRGIFQGFQGNYGDVFNTATQGVYDRRAIEQYGIMAARMATVQPSVENKFMRAENYQSALAGMIREGYRPEYLVSQFDTDIYRNSSKLTEAQRTQLRNEMITDEMKWSTQRWADMSDAEKKAAVNRIRNTEYYKQNEDKLGKLSDQDLYRTYENDYRIGNSVDRLLGAVQGTPEEIQRNLEELDTTTDKRMKKHLANQLGAFQLQEMVEPRAGVEQDFRNTIFGVRDRTGFMNKLQGDENAKMQQLIRMLGGADVNGDYALQAARGASTIMLGDMGGLDLERTVSLVSETGKMAQQLGLRGDSIQVAGNLAAYMAASTSMANGGKPLDQQALADVRSNAASLATSERSRQLTFLMSQNFKEGSKMAELKKKLEEGKMLSKEELDSITMNNLREDFVGNNFDQLMNSNEVFNLHFSQLSEEQQMTLNANLAESGIQDVKDVLSSDRYKSSFTQNIRGYEGNTDELYSLRTELWDKLDEDRVYAVLSGAPLTEEEKKKLGPELVKRIEAVKGQISDASQLKQSLQEGDALLMGQWKSEFGVERTAKQFGQGLRTNNPEVQKTTALLAASKKGLPVDFGNTLAEEFASSADSGMSYWDRLGRAARNAMHGGVEEIEKAKATLLNDHQGIFSIFTQAHANTENADQMFERLGLTDKEAAQLREALGVETNEEVWKAFNEADTYEKRKELTDKIATSKLGTTMEKKIGATMDEAAKQAKEEGDKANVPKDTTGEEAVEAEESEGGSGTKGAGAAAPAAEPRQKIPVEGNAVNVRVVNPTGKEQANVPEKGKG